MSQVTFSLEIGITALDDTLSILLISYFFNEFNEDKFELNVISPVCLSIEIISTLFNEETDISVFLSKNSTLSPTLSEELSILLKVKAADPVILN